MARKSLERLFQDRPFAFCATITIGAALKPFLGVPAEAQDWFDSSVARNCSYPGVTWHELLPLDEELIERMRHCEIIFMDTVNRLEWKRRIPYDTRKLWYLRHLRFWNDYLHRHRINLFLSAWLPHEIPDIIIYHLCKLQGIPVLYFRASTERDTEFAEHDLEESAFRLRDRYRALLAERPEGKAEDVVLNAAFEDRFTALTVPEGQKPVIESIKLLTYKDHVSQLLLRRPLQFLRFGLRYLSPVGWVRALGAMQRWRSVRARKAFYDVHAVEPDFSQPYVYMALHFQPEASSLPMGGAYADQVLMATLLDRFLPDGVLLYIKEHPRESGWLTRTIEQYQTLLSLKHVRLVKRSADTFKLREHCQAVATVTGSVGYEALFRGKPVFLFGHCFYQYAQGVHPIHTAEDCEKAVHAVFTEGKRPSPYTSRLFMKAMEESRTGGLLDPWGIRVTALPDEEHVRANAASLLRELLELEEAMAAVSFSR